MRFLSLIALSFCCFAPAVADQTRPNVVLILVDDMGWMDLSCQGSDYFRTPHIDDLARRGVRFTDAYAACAVCSPTRAAMMTGSMAGASGSHRLDSSEVSTRRNRHARVNPTEYVGGKNRKLLCPPNPYWMEHNETTLAELLQGNGYASCFIGKWHLGDPDWYPTSQGFDINIAGCDIGQPPSYFDPYTNPKYGLDGQMEPRKEGEFLTHREGDEASRFIREQTDNKGTIRFFCTTVPTPFIRQFKRSKRSRRNTSVKESQRLTPSTPPWSRASTMRSA